MKKCFQEKYNKRMSIKAIAAMSLNRVIGKGSEIPWYLPEDFKWFKKTTMGGVLVMGRKTYESIGRPLPGRDTVVLTRQKMTIPGVQVIHDLKEIKIFLSSNRTIWIAGGAEVYALGLPFCSDLYLSVVQQQVEGDVYFPSFKPPFMLHETLREGNDFHIQHYIHPNPQPL